ncbi:MAG: hypothetical protein US88_C0008G0051 [Parcubacteria group bacterium GW2011_GWA2_38_27]|nr:MAG: hypothetical protein US88_C0008G0051 [Parcubacteria group bacterium GW2011_GWA2_38_27]
MGTDPRRKLGDADEGCLTEEAAAARIGLTAGNDRRCRGSLVARAEENLGDIHLVVSGLNRVAVLRLVAIGIGALDNLASARIARVKRNHCRNRLAQACAGILQRLIQRYGADALGHLIAAVRQVQQLIPRTVQSLHLDIATEGDARDRKHDNCYTDQYSFHNTTPLLMFCFRR